MSKKKVAVAMSGGVDSGVTAALLVKKGYQCTGFHLHLWAEQKTAANRQQRFENKCCSTESLEAARKTAHQLGIDFHVLDYAKIFKKQVVDYFLKAYKDGLTPNPCIMCNKFIKFGELLDYIRKLDFDYLATGHYARVENGGGKWEVRVRSGKSKDAKYPPTLLTSRLTSHFSSSPYHLLMARDKSKDQSYFLYNLTQNQLAHVLFPLGEYQKKEVVAMARKWHLPVDHRPESQEICFLPENDYRFFLKRYLQEKIKPGVVVDVKGKIIGSHQGLPLYTIGQRHGFEINSKFKVQNSKLIPPYYVIRKDVKKNQLVVGFGKETERKEFFVENLNWLEPENFTKGEKVKIKCFVRIRHQGGLLSGEVEFTGGRAKVILDEPERGIAPGQAAVFYQKLKTGNYEVFGGGIIVDSH